MKMSQSDFDQLEKDFLTVLEKTNISLTERNIEKIDISKLMMRHCWDILNIITFDKTNEDDSIYFYKARNRYLAYVNSRWSLYNNGCNDSNIETAFKKIIKNNS